MIDIPAIRKKWFLEQIDALKHSGMSYKDIATRLGFSPQYLNTLRNTDRGVSENLALKLCSEFEINHNSLLMRIRQYESLEENTLAVSEKIQEYVTKRKKIPLFDAETIGGNNSLQADVTTPHYNESDLIDAGDWFPDATSAIRHYGDSMPEYPAGSILVLKRVQDYRLIVWGRNYSIETTEFRVTKRLQNGGEDYLIAYSTNKETYPDGKQIHEPIIIPKESVRHIDLVLGCVTLEYSSGAMPIIKSNK